MDALRSRAVTDDPFAEVADSIRRDAAARQDAESRRAEIERDRAKKFQDLVGEFLTRMDAAGSPGAVHEITDGRRKKLKAWALTYDDSDKLLQILLTTDGRIPTSRLVSRKGAYQMEQALISYTDPAAAVGLISDPGFDSYLGKLTRSMTSILIEHGLT